jgi:primosomal replication protein N
MGKGKFERFSLVAIADALDGSDVVTARVSLSQLVGAVVEVSGTVQKRVKRDGQCKLVIEPGASVPGFVVFADCTSDAENLTKLNIRKGSSVRVKGKFQTFGAAAVCLSECKLEQVVTLKKRNKRNNSTRTRTECFNSLKNRT